MEKTHGFMATSLKREVQNEHARHSSVRRLCDSPRARLPVNAWNGALANNAHDLAEFLWHKPEGKRCGQCLSKFTAKNAPAALVGITKFFETGGSHRVVRFICEKCNLNIRSEGPSADLQLAAELEIVGELLVPGPLNGEAHNGD